MTAQELLLHELEDAGFQLSRAAEGISEAALDHRASATAMTPREQFAHLCECYVAYLSQTRGVKHEWGSFAPASMQTDALLQEFVDKRKLAIDQVRLDASDENLRLAHLYVLAHDYYHVGQICQARLAVQGDWDPYAIYNF